MYRALIAVTLAALVYSHKLYAVKIFKCRDSNGRLVFSDHKCSKDAEILESDSQEVNILESAEQKLAVEKSKSAFKSALLNSDVATVQRLLEEQPGMLIEPIRHVDLDWPPLHIAVKEAHLELIKVLIQKGADLQSRNSQGEPAFHASFHNPHGSDEERQRREAVRRYLLSIGAEPDLTMSRGKMLVRAAASHGDIHTLSWLLNKKPAELELVAAMSAAIKSDQPDALKLLIGAGGDVNTELFGGNLILEAVRSNRTACTEILLDAGAVWQKPGLDLMHVAAEGGSVAMGQLLATAGVPVGGMQGPQGITPLMVAAKYNQTAFIEWLLANKADVHQTARNGEMALHVAAESGHADVVRLFIAHGANRNRTDAKGDTAKDRARKANHDELLNLL